MRGTSAALAYVRAQADLHYGALLYHDHITNVLAKLLLEEIQGRGIAVSASQTSFTMLVLAHTLGAKKGGLCHTALASETFALMRHAFVVNTVTALSNAKLKHTQIGNHSREHGSQL